MTDEAVFTGVPTMCLLPLNSTKFKVVRTFGISIPRSGVYNDIAPGIFDEASGAFNLLNESGTFYVPSITKVLLATSKYPKLEANQIFAPSVISFNDDDVIIDGVVLEILSVVQ